MAKKKTETEQKEAIKCPRCGDEMKFARNRQGVIDEYACPKCGTTFNKRV